MSTTPSSFVTRIPWRTWQPKLVESLASYDRRTFMADLVAGLTVGVVALPLAMAFGIASGVTPQAGIYTAIVGGFIVSLLGGSRIQIGGPTGAFVVIVAGIIAKHGLSGLLMVTMMAGVILVFLAITGLGQAVKFIPRPVVIGFTNGIALLIASTQIKDFFGLGVDPPSEFFERMRVLGESMGTLNPAAVALGIVSLALVLLVPRRYPRVPGSIVALVLGTLAVAAFGLPVETIGSKFGVLPGDVPPVDVPTFRADLILPLLPSALTVALLAAVESLLSAVVADSMTGDRHNSNAELLAQGVANLAAPLVGGIPVTGAIARTATNFRSGARTPVAGVIHALTLLIIVLLLAPLAVYVPLATLAAVLFVVAYNMGEWKEIPSVWLLDWADKSVWLITFALTVMADLTVAVEVGMSLAALLYIYRVTGTTTVSTVTPEYIEDGRVHVLQDKQVPPYVTILRIHGPFLFGMTDKLTDATADLKQFAPIVILRLRNMTAIDATGLHAIEELSDRLKKSGRTLILCGARAQPAELLHQTEFVEHVGEENIQPHVQAALERAREIQSRFSGVGDEAARDLVTIRM
ncbi:MAG: STAS domain-containing protein [Acidobacteria bacterium]|nr:STAS domain-containing protein [Acidobacteriota bacterium]